MNIELTFSDRTARLKIEGILTSDNSYLLQEKLNEILNGESNHLELDLLECKNISSTGIGKILLFSINYKVYNPDLLSRLLQ